MAELFSIWPWMSFGLSQKKTNVGAPDKYGRMPLHAVKTVAAARVLLKFGANVHGR